MKISITVIAAAFAAMIIVASPMHAQSIYEANFDSDGDGEGWIDFANRGGGAIAGGEFAGGIAGAAIDIQLRTDFDLDLDPNGAFASIRWRETDDGVTPLTAAQQGTGTSRLFGGDFGYLNPGAGNTAGTNQNVGTALSLSDDPNGYVIGVWDVGTWFAGLAPGLVEDGDLDSLRFDPVIAGASTTATWQVDYIRLFVPDEGDANFDGFVDSLDFELISDNLFNTVAVGTDGDITRDGVVNYADYRLWRDRIAALPLSVTGQEVPEPTSAALLLLGVSSLLAMKRNARNAFRCLSVLALLSTFSAHTATSSYAQVVYTAGFNVNGDAEGWEIGSNISTLTVSGGLLSGVNSNSDPQLSGVFTATPIGGTHLFDTLSFRVLETPLAPSDPNWDPLGIVVGLSPSDSSAQTIINGNANPELFSAVSSGSNFHTVTVDISSYEGIDIDFIRLDPIGGPDAASSSFDIDFIEITRGPLFGDVDDDGDVDLIDKTILRDNLFETGLPRSQGDLNEDGIVDFDDFREWKNFYVPPPSTVAVPEPSSVALLGIGFGFILSFFSPGGRFRTATCSVRQATIVFCLLTLTASQAKAQIDIHWEQDVDNNYATAGNWVGGIVPDASFDERAIIGNSTVPTGTANVSSVISGNQRPGAVVLGEAAGQSGTLNINSGGDLEVINSPGAPVGAVQVGIGNESAGTGILNVLSGGSLTARGLTLGGNAASQVNISGTGILSLEDTSDPNFEANMNLFRTTRITGPDASVSATGNLTLGSVSTFIPEITAATHTAISVGGTAILGGDLQVEFNGVSPVSGQSWDLIDAAAINGSFNNINVTGATLGLGEQFSLVNQLDGGSINGRTLSLEVEQLLILEVNRDTNIVSIKNPSGIASVGFDGYTISSPSSSIQSSAWNSLQDNVSFSDWEEAQNSDDSRLTEIKILGEESLGSTTSVSLGTVYNPQTPSFGVTGEDYTFEYTEEDGTNRTGIVQYTGSDPANINTLVLQVDPGTGEAILYNDSGLFNGTIEGYDISSDSGSLLFSDGNWSSLDDQNSAGGDWRESNVSANQVAELKEDGDTTLTLNSGTIFNLGILFDTGGTQDLAFSFLQAGDSTPTDGVVIYEAISSLPGDFDGDGTVDGLDFLVWQRNPAVGNLADWETNYGTSLVVVAGAVPEPSTVLLTGVLGISWILRPRGRTA